MALTIQYGTYGSTSPYAGKYYVSGVSGSDTSAFTLTIPAKADSIDVVGVGGNAFRNLTTNAPRVVNIVLPSGIINIGAWLFGTNGFAGGTMSINIPNTVQNISGGAFYAMPGYRVGTSFASGNPYLRYENGLILSQDGTHLFSSNPGYVTSEEVSLSSVITIDDYALYGARMQRVIFGDSVVSVGASALSHCPSLKTAIIPDSVTTIGDSAFNACNADLVIFCEALSKPAGWSSSWNAGNYPVVWDSANVHLVNSMTFNGSPITTWGGKTIKKLVIDGVTYITRAAL